MLVNLAGADDAKKFVTQKGIKSAISLAGRPGPEYGIKYIPHKVLLDKHGTVVQNFKFDWAKVDALL
jgi:hypothetical protein